VNWRIEFDLFAAKEFKKLDINSQEKISHYLREKVLKNNNPKDLGKPLRYDYATLWRYRVDKFRIICHIEDRTLVILVLKIGLRDKVYKS
jgi:mRNA interferase RelE/StbE